MEIYTLHVGQGNFNIIIGETEAIIVDTYVPLNPETPIINVKGALANILSGKNLVGLILTGFDADHFNEVGLKIVLNKYLPNWIMYPKYFKKSSNADSCFKIIEEHDKNKSISRYSVLLDKDDTRFYTKISNDFEFEVFSPHSSDMGSSNNCSLVCKVYEKSTSTSYLITGDTENSRWAGIVKVFGSSLKTDVLVAPHHGSKNGCVADMMTKISPNTILVSAGIDNQYGHPDAEAKKIFSAYAQNWYQTNYKPDGQSLKTVITNSAEIKTYKYT